MVHTIPTILDMELHASNHSHSANPLKSYNIRVDIVRPSNHSNWWRPLSSHVSFRLNITTTSSNSQARPAISVSCRLISLHVQQDVYQSSNCTKPAQPQHSPSHLSPLPLPRVLRIHALPYTRPLTPSPRTARLDSHLPTVCRGRREHY